MVVMQSALFGYLRLGIISRMETALVIALVLSMNDLHSNDKMQVRPRSIGIQTIEQWLHCGGSFGTFAIHPLVQR